MARLSSFLLLLAGLLALSGAMAQGGVYVVAPGTRVNVGWNGGGGGGGGDNSDCGGVHAQWIAACGGCKGGLFHAELDGKQMVAPNSTTPAPIDTPATGHAWVCVSGDDGSGTPTTITTRLVLCNLKGYVASHHHFDPLGPPSALPMLSPPLDIGDWHKCRSVQVTSSPSDLIVVPGGPPSWGDLLAAMQRGDVYVNAHTTSHPDGEIRGNFEKC